MLEQIVAHEDTFALAAVFGTMITAIVVFGGGWVVVSVVRILSRDRLKNLMIDRGMSPEEIKQVLQAGSEVWPRSHRRELCPESKPDSSWS